ncbi:hypothetical protein B0H19DRAFT_324426 [Mycena capillaripes]|nr:hypothetical protein B0H19DRAFT_324426 [Mycena capillaripes]
MSTQPSQPPRVWTIWQEAFPLNRRLAPWSHPVIFDAFDNLRSFLLSEKALTTLTALTFDDDTVSPTSSIFMERKRAILLWLYDEPPRVDFVNFGSQSRPSEFSTPFFARTYSDRRQTVRIQLARSLFIAICDLDKATQHKDCHPRVRCQTWILIFLLERALMHEITHAARFVFSTTRASPPQPSLETHVPVTLSVTSSSVVNTPGRWRPEPEVKLACTCLVREGLKT